MEIIKAELNCLPGVSRLFDLYRQYYECDPDLELATRYLKARIEKSDSDIFVAIEKGHACGFVQLYPTFCSIQASKIYILHDLYVEADYRRSGFAERLMNKATQWAKDNDAARLDLLTEKTNNAGQALYEKLGYKKVLQEFHAYSLDVLQQE